MTKLEELFHLAFAVFMLFMAPLLTSLGLVLMLMLLLLVLL